MRLALLPIRRHSEKHMDDKQPTEQAHAQPTVASLLAEAEAARNDLWTLIKASDNWLRLQHLEGSIFALKILHDQEQLHGGIRHDQSEDQ